MSDTTKRIRITRAIVRDGSVWPIGSVIEVPADEAIELLNAKSATPADGPAGEIETAAGAPQRKNK